MFTSLVHLGLFSLNLHCTLLSALIVVLVSKMDEGCCGSKPSKELQLHVSSVGADNDLFTVTSLDDPGTESKTASGLQDAIIVKR
jgi:hypothetical protein